MFYSANPIRVATSTDGKQLIKSNKITSSFRNIGGFNNHIPNVYHTHKGAAINGIDVTTPYVDPIPHKLLCKMYKDIYMHDAVSGAAVDLIANLPFSDFKLQIPAKQDREKIKEKFEENIERLKINVMLPSAAREYMVFGAHVSHLIYKTSERIFTDSMPFAYEDCHIITNPLFGRDPIIRVVINEEIAQFFNDTSDISKDIINRLNPDLIEALKSGAVELQPMNTIYFPRKTFSNQDLGMSLYRRILPIYFLEKVLLRGTITMANRRQAPVKHIVAGDDEWIPTPKELQELTSVFTNVDTDPIGGIVATRDDVNVNEIISGGDFWKWNDIKDEMNATKLLAFGINESFLSGDMSYNSMETALSVFMESLKAFRDQTCNQFFYNKLFPLISTINGFTFESYGKIDNETIQANFNHSPGFSHRKISNKMEYQMSDTSSLVIPIIEWEKKLEPQGNEEHLSLLDRLMEKGVPVPLRAIAAAGGYSIEDLMEQTKSDIKLEKEIKKIKDEQNKIGGNEGENNELANFHDAILPNIGLANREFSDQDYEMREETPTGKRKWVFNQDKRQRKANEMIADNLTKMAEEKGHKPKKYRGVKIDE